MQIIMSKKDDTKKGSGNFPIPVVSGSLFYVMQQMDDSYYEQMSIGFEKIEDAMKFKAGCREVDKPDIMIFQNYR